MALRVLVHIANEDPFFADLDQMPAAHATNVVLSNPHGRDQKPVPWAHERLRAVVFPMSRIMFMEVVITKADEREVVGFIRDDTKGHQ